MTTFQFHFPASGETTVTIPLPEELRGVPFKIVLEKETTPKRSTMREFVEKYSGILKDCGMENVEAMKKERINDMIKRHQ